MVFVQYNIITIDDLGDELSTFTLIAELKPSQVNI